MWALLRRNPLAAVLAVLMHVAILAFLVIGVDWRKPPQPIESSVQVVQAQLVDEAQLNQRQQQLESEQRRKQAEAAAELQRKAQEREAKKQAEEEARRQAEAKRKAEEEEEARRQAEAKRKAEVEARRQAEAKKQAEEEARRQAEAKRKAEEEARRQAEAKRKAEEEARRKAEAEAERKRQAEARARAERAARESELAAQLQAERDATEIAQVVAAIRQKVERNWLRPPGTAEQGLTCRVRVRLGSNGTVLLVDVIESSGNGAFDRSVEAAVRKADPLPMPTSARLQARFRELTFEFDPAG